MKSITGAIILIAILCSLSGCVFHNNQGAMRYLTLDHNSYNRSALVWDEYDLRPMRRNRVEYFRWSHPINKMAITHLEPSIPSEGINELSPYSLPVIPSFESIPPAPTSNTASNTEESRTTDGAANSTTNSVVPVIPPFPSTTDIPSDYRPQVAPLEEQLPPEPSMPEPSTPAPSSPAPKNVKEPRVPMPLEPHLPQEARGVSPFSSVASISLTRKIPSKVAPFPKQPTSMQPVSVRSASIQKRVAPPRTPARKTTQNVPARQSARQPAVSRSVSKVRMLFPRVR